jgi:hypothetical protein
MRFQVEACVALSLSLSAFGISGACQQHPCVCVCVCVCVHVRLAFLGIAGSAPGLLAPAPPPPPSAPPPASDFEGDVAFASSFPCLLPERVPDVHTVTQVNDQSK